MIHLVNREIICTYFYRLGKLNTKLYVIKKMILNITNNENLLKIKYKKIKSLNKEQKK